MLTNLIGVNINYTSMKLGVGGIPCDIFYIKVKNRQFMILKGQWLLLGGRQEAVNGRRHKGTQGYSNVLFLTLITLTL